MRVCLFFNSILNACEEKDGRGETWLCLWCLAFAWPCFFFLCSRAKRGVDVVLIAFLRCLRAFVWKHRVVHPFLMAGQDGFAHRLSSLLYGEGVEGSFFSLSLSRCARMRAGDWFGVFWRGEEE